MAVLNLGRRMRRGSDEIAGARRVTAIEAPEGVAWRLNRQTQVLRSPDTRSVKLSVREVILLEHLAARPDETVSRNLIMGLFGHARSTPKAGVSRFWRACALS
ncbi:hypothetical protein AB6806_19370 [Bosea sp. RCC_152_1]|uniref:hypothetical protein n=1 Tax=Bosea sp. RCC_152_1 TaxID=3239228 RepID=UPI0035244FFF